MIIVYDKIRHIILLVFCALFFVCSGGDEAFAQSLTTPFPSSFRNAQANDTAA